MFLANLEYRGRRHNAYKIPCNFYIKLTLRALKLEEQKGLDTLVVQAVNNNCFSFSLKGVVNAQTIYLNSIFARRKFKELDVEKNNPWIMLVNTIIRVNLTRL